MGWFSNTVSRVSKSISKSVAAVTSSISRAVSTPKPSSPSQTSVSRTSTPSSKSVFTSPIQSRPNVSGSGVGTAAPNNPYGYGMAPLQPPLNQEQIERANVLVATGTDPFVATRTVQADKTAGALAIQIGQNTTMNKQPPVELFSQPAQIVAQVVAQNEGVAGITLGGAGQSAGPMETGRDSVYNIENGKPKSIWYILLAGLIIMVVYIFRKKRIPGKARTRK